MTFKYRIIEVNPDDHQIVVRFTTHVLSEDLLAVQWDGDGNILRCCTDVAITLPVPPPEGDALKELIMRRAPLELIRTKAFVASPDVDTTMSSVLPLLGVEVAMSAFEVTDLTRPRISKVKVNGIAPDPSATVVEVF